MDVVELMQVYSHGPHNPKTIYLRINLCWHRVSHLVPNLKNTVEYFHMYLYVKLISGMPSCAFSRMELLQTADSFVVNSTIVRKEFNRRHKVLKHKVLKQTVGRLVRVSSNPAK